MGKFKGPNKAEFLRGGTVPHSLQSDDDRPPAFSFEKMQDGSGNSFNCCQDEDRLALAKRIFMLSRMPWKQIRQAPSSGLGSEQIPRKRIKRPIPTSVTEDVDSFSSLHFSGKKRFVGYRVGQIFHILWVDHSFEVYDHGS
ncbi:hypothetical protein LRC39_09565 [Rhodopseudomonas sp. P1]|uniref:hypothetical protein n=1 Tax=Rhodopseudomonas sp. P1 TaxID=3434357 RepID=UPI0031FC786C